MQSENLRSFFKFLCGKKTESKFTDKLPELINRVKMNAKWRQNYMTWEQEMRIQSRYLAEELAPELAKDLAKDMAKDMAKDIAKDMAKDMATDMAKDIAKDMAKDMAEEAAKEKVKETALNLLRLNVAAVDQIAQATGLSVDEVRELNDTLQSVQA